LINGLQPLLLTVWGISSSITRTAENKDDEGQKNEEDSSTDRMTPLQDPFQHRGHKIPISPILLRIPPPAAGSATQAPIGGGHSALPPTFLQMFAVNNQGPGAHLMPTVPITPNSGTQATMGQAGMNDAGMTTNGIYPQPLPANASSQQQQGNFNPAPGPSNGDESTTQSGSQPTAGNLPQRTMPLGRFPHISQSFSSAQGQADVTMTAAPTQ
jgi:hypothetical protein